MNLSKDCDADQAVLSATAAEQFANDGVVVLPGFYDARADIEPIQRAIHTIIALVASKYQVNINQLPFEPSAFDSGFGRLIATDRAHGGEVYDAVKQIPAFVRLVANSKNEQIVRQLRPQAAPAIAGGGYGIRIDTPHEDRFRANWHQEYPAQLRSVDGLVFWSPLVTVTEVLGPVTFCLGSHRAGPLPVHTRDPRDATKTGAYGLTLQNESKVVSSYPKTAPLTQPGDLVIVDFLTLHASGHNRDTRSRWSMQFRYFNFLETTGRAHGWKGSYAAGVDFSTIHPELCAD
jgi:ectoine hydroxylase-related dioxygenase (phytanoyl-CoA dioxygenase family)